jgi:hypothetical protein
VQIKDKSFDEILTPVVKTKKNFYSFIDIALPYHKDQINFGYEPISKDYYFINLFSLFRKINKMFNLDVHIILHPSYKKKDYIKITFKMELKNSTIIMGSLSGNVNSKMVSLTKVLR